MRIIGIASRTRLMIYTLREAIFYREGKNPLSPVRGEGSEAKNNQD